MDIRFKIVLVLVGLVTGLFLALQVRPIIPEGERFLDAELEARDELIKEYLDEQSFLRSRISALREDIEETQQELDKQSQIANLSLLDNLKKQLGLTEVSGTGLEIILGDSPQAVREAANVSDEKLVQASDIRDIINLLNAGHAEAISINQQRIIATSTIVSVGTSILINNSHVAPPFEIKAVGDTDAMVQRILNSQSVKRLFEKRDNGNLVLDMFKRGSITINAYNEDLNVENINLVNE